MSDDALDRIERELTLLVRRAMKVRVDVPGHDGQSLDRSSYAILARLHHCGPSRLTALAHAFDLDVSTVSRQVQALGQAGLVERATDPGDRRAALLTLTEAGRDVVDASRARRHQRLVAVVDRWPSEDRDVFARLLEQFNADMTLAGPRPAAPVPPITIPTATNTASPPAAGAAPAASVMAPEGAS